MTRTWGLVVAVGAIAALVLLVHQRSELRDLRARLAAVNAPCAAPATSASERARSLLPGASLTGGPPSRAPASGAAPAAPTVAPGARPVPPARPPAPPLAAAAARVSVDLGDAAQRQRWLEQLAGPAKLSAAQVHALDGILADEAQAHAELARAVRDGGVAPAEAQAEDHRRHDQANAEARAALDRNQYAEYLARRVATAPRRPPD